MRAIFARASLATGGHSDGASVVPQWASMPHQINATFPSVVDDDELESALTRAVPRALLRLARLRRDHPAFDGDFSWDRPTATSVRLRSRLPEATLELDAEFAPVRRGFELRSTMAGGQSRSNAVGDLAAGWDSGV